jgi:hypothetical protein
MPASNDSKIPTAREKNSPQSEFSKMKDKYEFQAI